MKLFESPLRFVQLYFLDGQPVRSGVEGFICKGKTRRRDLFDSSGTLRTGGGLCDRLGDPYYRWSQARLALVKHCLQYKMPVRRYIA